MGLEWALGVPERSPEELKKIRSGEFASNPRQGGGGAAVLPPLERRKFEAARLAKIRSDLLEGRDRAFAAAGVPGATPGQSKVQVEFVNAPAGMVVKDIKAAPGQSVDVKTKRGARALGTGSGL
jgi:hypothetical protein